MEVDPHLAAFWSESELNADLLRVAEICHGCRLCFNLCPSFPELFQRIDNADGEVDRLVPADYEAVGDLCYQCKLCFVKCPYTPPHEYDLDFPRLMLRFKAQRARKRGFSLQERFLGNTDFIGTLGSALAPLSNWANANLVNRKLMERAVGIDHRHLLPRYHKQTFHKWFQRRAVQSSPGDKGKVALFYTCYVNYNQPEVGQAAVAVLEHNGLAVSCPPQRCCGMPYLDVGDVGSATKNAVANAGPLFEAIAAGHDIVVLGPTCSYMLKQEYPLLLGPEAKILATHVFDAGEYLMRLHKKGLLSTSFKGAVPGKIAYHAPCHLRAQNIGLKSRDLLQLIGSTVQTVERCCGVDGTWGMRKEYHDMSLRVGAPLFEAVKKASPDLVATDCPLAAMQIGQGAGFVPKHPLLVLREAYGI